MFSSRHPPDDHFRRLAMEPLESRQMLTVSVPSFPAQVSVQAGDPRLFVQPRLLTASGNQAQMAYTAGNTVGVANFDAVYARSKNGSTNRRIVVNPLAYSLVFEGLWV